MTHAFELEGEVNAKGAEWSATGVLNITSYTNLGEVLAASTLKLPKPISRIEILEPVSDEGYMFRWNGTKMLALGGDASDAEVTVTDGVAHRTQLFTDLLGATNTAAITDQVSGAVNDEAYVALRAAADETLASFVAQPDHPRSVMLTLEANGGAATLPTAGSITVNGIDALTGAVVSKVFDISAETGDFGTGTIAENNFRYVDSGVDVFASITDVVVDVDGNEANLRWALGPGTRIGLSTQLNTPAAADIIAVQKTPDSTGKPVKVGSGTYSVSTTTHSVKMGADLADNDDVSIEYAVDADTASALTGAILGNKEASAATDVGACRIRAYANV